MRRRGGIKGIRAPNGRNSAKSLPTWGERTEFRAPWTSSRLRSRPARSFRILGYLRGRVGEGGSNSVVASASPINFTDRLTLAVWKDTPLLKPHCKFLRFLKISFSRFLAVSTSGRPFLPRLRLNSHLGLSKKFVKDTSHARPHCKFFDVS